MLPTQMRRCVQFRAVEDLSYQEIASIMGLSQNTVKAHLYQARKILRDKLEPFFREVDV
jgi:RNA polymerase sigma-70 factor (ECF subfamily)